MDSSAKKPAEVYLLKTKDRVEGIRELLGRFDLAQISRAAEIGVGVGSAEEIKVVPLDERSIKTAEELQEILEKEG